MACVKITIRKLHRNYHSLVGKYLMKPYDLTVDELKSLLWTAIELKQLHERKELGGDLLKNKLVLLQTIDDDVQNIPLAAACNILHANLYKMVKPKWDTERDLQNQMEFVDTNVDMLFCQSTRCQGIISMAQASRIPVVSVMSCRYAISSILADVMALQLHFGRLRGLTLTWFGAPGKFINTYMEFGTRLGMDVRYCCSCDPDRPLTPLVMQDVIYDEFRRAKVEEIIDSRRIKKKSHVIILSLSKNSNFDLKSAIANTEDNWVFIQKPYMTGTIDQVLIKNSIVSESTKNSKYVLAAIMLRYLLDYQHKTPTPKFD